MYLCIYIYIYIYNNKEMGVSYTDAHTQTGLRQN